MITSMTKDMGIKTQQLSTRATCYYDLFCDVFFRLYLEIVQFARKPVHCYKCHLKCVSFGWRILAFDYSNFDVKFQIAVRLVLRDKILRSAIKATGWICALFFVLIFILSIVRTGQRLLYSSLLLANVEKSNFPLGLDSRY